jgi:tRNA-splicing ligase RtcB
VLELATARGGKLVGTADHGILTPSGYRNLGDLKPGERVASVAYDGILWDRAPERVVLTERHVRAAARRIGMNHRGNALSQALRSISRLLPMTQAHPAFPVLLKVAGLALGAGTLDFERGSGKGRLIVRGRKEDLLDVARDLRPWVGAWSIDTRPRRRAARTARGAGRVTSTAHHLRVSSTGFALLLVALGLPAGPKTSQDWQLPRCLFRAPAWQKRLFLAGLFGAELTSPDAFDARNRSFRCPVLNLVKRGPWLGSGRRVLEEVRRLLWDLGVRSLTASDREEPFDPDDTRPHRLRLVVSSEIENLISLWGRVGFEYNRKRARLAAQAVAYLKEKRIALAARHRARDRILEIRSATGWSAHRIHDAVAGEGVSRRFVERTISGRGDRAVRSPEGFATFDAWRKENCAGDLVWDRVLAVVPRPDVRRVYDLSVEHNAHNFIAGGLVVHNCGVRVAKTGLRFDTLEGLHKKLASALFAAVPCGVGEDSAIPKPSKEDALRIVTEGARWAVEKGYGRERDLLHTEDAGAMPGADPSGPSDTAYARGMAQVGTLGSGNHFLELDRVAETYAPEAESVFGLREGDVVLLIHCGSRGFGHQICDENVRGFVKAASKYGIRLVDRQLACAPASSPEGRRYLGAMACAANFAWVNRQVIMGLAEKALARTLGKPVEMELIYDVCHNIAKVETHDVDGVPTRLIVHRKGATRAFPPGHPLTPALYRDVGQPVLVPGDMGRASYLLTGLPGAMKETFGSTCHGAGRVASRSEMNRRMARVDIDAEMRAMGVTVRSKTRASMAEEMPDAYKDAGEVVHVMERAGISRRIAKFAPFVVIKG